MHYLIKDSTLKTIFEILNNIKGIHKKCPDRLRNFLEAVCYVARSGCQWRLLPKYYGSWRAIHKRFKSWSEWGIWEKIFKNSQNDPDMEWVMIDSTIVRAHACSAGFLQEREALGRSRGGFSTKIHAITDALGNPLRLILTAGQRNDITQGPELIKNIFETTCLADKGYDSDSFIAMLKKRNCTPEIPCRSNRKIPRAYDKILYKERNAIECFFGKIKHFRRVFSRFDKTAKSYLSFLHFVGALIWMR